MNLRGAYMAFAHDRAADWQFLREWQPSVIRLMLPGSHSAPASVDVNRIRRVHETVPDALIIVRVWDVDDRNGEAHAAMQANPEAEADKQHGWWASLIESVPGVPRHQLIAGAVNEPNPHSMGEAIRRYNVRLLQNGTNDEIRYLGYVFSVGQPPLPGEGPFDWTYFAQAEQVFVDGDHLCGLHSYMQPEGMYAVWTDDQGTERKDYGYLIGRHLHCPMTRVKIVVAEWGIDGLIYNRHPDPQYGNSGWRNFPEWTPDRYADEYVECVRKAGANVIGICPYIADAPDRKWNSFDPMPAYAALLARKHLCERQGVVVTIPPPGPTPPPPIVVTPPAEPPITRGTITASVLNVRNAPGTVATTVLDQLTGGDSVNVYESRQDAEGFLWHRIGRDRWVHSAWVELEGGAPAPPNPFDFDSALAFVLRWEGGWADNPHDDGGATMKGITLATYTRWRAEHGQPKPTKDDLRNIPDAELRQIYHDYFWVVSGSDKLPSPLKLVHFDTSVLFGPGGGKAFLDKSGGNVDRYLALRLNNHTRDDDWPHFGMAWTRRVADLMGTIA